ncbi:MAG: hypothetical protein R3B92_02585 [Patescibacteria group bacterium]|uniref:DUF1610 domain-containing protein n=1 Tax=candidate division WWE3 bacterium TaxID=2053526 RepID=A0A955EC10_UNCKA|nr:hypothetical protein [candidate division WWE3 bacterium]
MDENINTQQTPVSEAHAFVCPNCGQIEQDDVAFLCNSCEQKDLEYRDGIYLCPECMIEGENFQCMKCDSKNVKMIPPITEEA